MLGASALIDQILLNFVVAMLRDVLKCPRSRTYTSENSFRKCLRRCSIRAIR